MRVLLITGMLAENIVRTYAMESGVEFSVKALPIPVAALMSPAYIARELEKEKPLGFDLVLTPGLIEGDVSIVEKAIGIPTFKGPRYAADLPLVLKALDRVKLSKEVPACKVIETEARSLMLKELKALDLYEKSLKPEEGCLMIGNGEARVVVGRGLRVKVVAEILNAPVLSNAELKRKAVQYASEGADIIDLGMLAENPKPMEVKRLISTVKHAVKLPVSIDTLNPDEIDEALKHGVDMVISLERSNIQKLKGLNEEVAFVVIPADNTEGFYPKDVDTRVKMLEDNIALAKRMGITRLLGDLILDPINSPSLTESLIAYYEFSKRNPQIPLLMGIGNVTELIDADSIGVNALMIGIAQELGVALVLTTEGSVKTRNAVREASIATRMMALAAKRGSPPKDLELSLLALKEKRFKEVPYEASVEVEAKVVKAVKTPKERVKADAKGYFKIAIDRVNGEIAVIHYPLGSPKPDLVVKGREANSLYKTLVKLQLVSELSHAAYLGLELAKAELALLTGRSYVQDAPLADVAPAYR
ncbi:MAG: dihydropteroate synthase-like protein [Candidatus Nezhaarchaeales archaeon]